MTATEPALTLHRQVWFRSDARQGKEETDIKTAGADASRIPRVARLLALAIRYEQLLHAGHVRDYRELSQLGKVSRARITQIMNLRLLAPDVQEAILFLGTHGTHHDPISERDLRPIVAEVRWSRQRAMWAQLAQARSLPNQSASQ